MTDTSNPTAAAPPVSKAAPDDGPLVTVLRLLAAVTMLAGASLLAVAAAATLAGTLLARAPASTTASAATATEVSPRVEWRPIGRSVQGRPVVAASFGRGTRHVLYVGGIHGNEFGTDVAELFAVYLAKHPSAVPAGTRIDIVACADPDGRALGLRGNARNVNINRNFPSRDWMPFLIKGRTAGPRPNSEPETQALVRYLARGYAVVVSLHSRGGLVDFDGPGSLLLARRVAGSAGFVVKHLNDENGITGSLGRYVPERYGVPVITIELADPVLTSRLADALLQAAR